MKKRSIRTILTVTLLALALTVPALAQEEIPELDIRLTRDWGYGGFGGDIQGLFSIKVSGPDDLAEVQFYIDETLLGTENEAPYKIQFNTDDFDPGLRKIYAVGTLSDGTELYSEEITAEFLSKENAGDLTMKLVVPILGFTVLAMVIAAVIPMLTGKKGGDVKIGEYGAAGGAICPRCEFPFSRHWLSPNMVIGKLVRCPHCGKWSIRPAASRDALSAAEQRYLASQEESSEVEVDPDQGLKSALEDSRFEE
jgi:hypothetical protein